MRNQKKWYFALVVVLALGIYAYVNVPIKVDSGSIDMFKGEYVVSLKSLKVLRRYGYADHLLQRDHKITIDNSGKCYFQSYWNILPMDSAVNDSYVQASGKVNVVAGSVMFDLTTSDGATYGFPLHTYSLGGDLCLVNKCNSNSSNNFIVYEKQ